MNPFTPADFDRTADWDALARYLAGESDRSEAARIEAWLSADPGRAALLAGLRRHIDHMGQPAAPEVDVAGALARVKARIREEEIGPPRDRPARSPMAPAAQRSTPVWRRSPALALAATVTLLLVGSLAFFLARAPDRLDPLAGSGRQYTTGVGQLLTLELPDGTSVLLAPGSELLLSDRFGDTDREVRLSGEALFTVTRAEAPYFQVRVPNGIVQDLGTAFSVRTTGDGAVRVSVTEGAVRVVSEALTGQVVELRAGDRGGLEGTGAIFVERDAVTAADLAWIQGLLSFREAPLAEIGTDLRRWYGYELRLASPGLAERRLTVSFAGEDAAEVGRVLALTLGIETEVRGDTIILRTGVP